MTLGKTIVGTLFGIAIISAICFVIVQMVDETRDEIAALVLKPIPAICLSAACFTSMAAIVPVSKDPTRRRNSGWKGCRIDTWCLFFGIGFAFFVVGDTLLAVHVAPHTTLTTRGLLDIEPSSLDFEIPKNYTSSSTSSFSQSDDSKREEENELKFEISGVSMFAVGHLFLLSGQFLRRDDESLPFVVSPTVTIMYIILGVVSWVMFTVWTTVSTCQASFSMAALLATYFLIVIAVAWRATDLFIRYNFTGAIFVAFGANLFFVSDVIVGTNSLCNVIPDEAIYYLFSMTTYYIAIVLEAYGVTKFATETRDMAGAMGAYNA